VGGIPLGPTGIMINSLDAGFGFNYYMDYLNIENSTHKHLSYTGSLGLGIAGGNFLNVSGNVGMNFSPGYYDLNFGVDLEVPQKNPSLVASGNMTYVYNEKENDNGSISGKLDASLKIPPGSGSLFSMESGLDFSIKDDQWILSPSENKAVEGKILNEIDFSGNVVARGNPDNLNDFEGELDGAIDYEMKIDKNYSIIKNILEVNNQIVFDVKSELKSTINQSHFEIEASACSQLRTKIEAFNPFSGIKAQGEIEISGNIILFINDAKSFVIINGVGQVIVNDESYYNFTSNFKYDFSSLSLDESIDIDNQLYDNFKNCLIE
jgi:hypothetical protein